MAEEVLIVDDYLPLRKMLYKILTREGYKTSVASNGKEAIQIAGSKNLALILMDINMPGIDGIEACARLKSIARTATVPVIMMSGSDFSNVEANSIGADDFLRKPFDINDLIKRVSSTLHLRRL